MYRLIATDIDGTLLTSSKTVTPRTIAALRAAADAGVHVVPISGRQAHVLRPVVELAGVDGYAVCANGAVCYHLGRDEVVFENLLSVPAQTELVTRLREVRPEVRCVSVRDAGRTFVPEVGYVGMMDPGDHGAPHEIGEFPLAEVLAAPSVKLVARQTGVAPEELLADVVDLDVAGCQPTISGAPFVEVADAGVTKASGLERLCGILGVQQHEVIAFGDHLNDLDLLQWAGRGIAMGNGLDDVKQAADEVTLTNDEDGLAVVIERVLRDVPATR